MNTQDHRDLIGYGANPPQANWPGNARIAVNFVLNYEEGAEYCTLDGDAHSESILADMGSHGALLGQRHLNVESVYEYGSRAGVWRILRAFQERQVPLTVYAVGLALRKNPAIAEAIREHGYDVVSHAWRWIDYHNVDEHIERDHIARCVATIAELTGARPLGWYTGRPSPNTRRLVVEEGGFWYDCDAYNDDLPYWTLVNDKPHLVICHCLDTNDTRLSRGEGMNYGEEWFAYMRDSFDTPYAEGESAPKFLTVALHCRIMGRPGRIGALQRLLDHILKHDRVWLCKRLEVASHWREHHPYEKA